MKIPSLIAKPALDIFLRLHSYSYHMAGLLSAKVEPDGLHPKHRIMDYHRFFMDHVGKDDTVLDVGCGNGALAVDVAPCCRKLIGIDLNQKSIVSAQKRALGRNLTNVEFVYGDATKVAFEQKIDCVILSNVLEHIEERVSTLKKLGEISKKFLIRVPMINREWIAVYKKERGLDYRLDPTHYIEYTIDEFKKELTQAGLTIDKYQIQFGEIWCVSSKN